MKKIILLITLIFSLTSFSQTLESSRIKFENLIKKQHLKNNNALAKTTTLVNLRDSSYQWNWNSSASTWNNPYKNIFNYNAAYKENSNYEYYFTGTIWQPIYRYTSYTFDINNNLLSNIYQDWSGSAWNNNRQTINTYDVSNNLLNVTTQNWVSSAWQNYSKGINTYDASNNLLSNLYQNWNTSTSTWENNNLDIYTYDANNNMLSYLSKSWNTTTTAWENQYKETYTYNTSNEITSYSAQNWDSSLSIWENGNMVTAIVYTSGDLISFVIQNWNSTTSMYENSFKGTSTYDANHHILTQISENYNTTTLLWENSYKTTYTYDVNGNQITQLDEFWDSSTSTWKNNYRVYDYYTSFVGLNESAKNNASFNLFPNPASNLITVSVINNNLIKTVNIIDITGKIVLSQTENNVSSSMINISELEAGIYTVEIKSNSNSTYKKIVKQ